MTGTLPEDLRAASQLLVVAADRIDELEAIVERDHLLIGRMERTLLHDHHIGGD